MKDKKQITSQKYCKDCKHFESFSYCAHPSHGIYIVTGEIRTKLAHEMRKEYSACKIEGELWEPKKPWYKFWS